MTSLYSSLEDFIKRISRLLYTDDLTPILVDYLIKYHMYDNDNIIITFSGLKSTLLHMSLNWKTNK